MDLFMADRPFLCYNTGNEADGGIYREESAAGFRNKGNSF